MYCCTLRPVLCCQRHWLHVHLLVRDSVFCSDDE